MEPNNFFGLDPLFAIVPIAVAVVGVVVLLGMIAVVILIVRNARKVSQAGHDPSTLQVDLAMKAMDSTLLAPARGIEDRLRELDNLRATGAISAEEHTTARATVLGGRS